MDVKIIICGIALLLSCIYILNLIQGFICYYIPCYYYITFIYTILCFSLFENYRILDDYNDLENRFRSMHLSNKKDNEIKNKQKFDKYEKLIKEQNYHNTILQYDIECNDKIIDVLQIENKRNFITSLINNFNSNKKPNLLSRTLYSSEEI